MRIVRRGLVVLAVFVGVGWLAARAVLAHAANAGAVQPEVRLSAAMAALFVGGAAATVALIALVWKRG